MESERKEKVDLLSEWEGKQDDLNELISQLEEDLADRNLQLSDYRRKVVYLDLTISLHFLLKLLIRFFSLYHTFRIPRYWRRN